MQSGLPNKIINKINRNWNGCYSNSLFYYEKKEEILNLLKKISYPGFSRDIVSFGMVSDIQIEESKLKINLKIKGDNEEKKRQGYL